MSDPFADSPDLVACAQLVERGDPDRFAAAMAAPVAARAVLFPLYAFNVEVSRAPWVTKEPMIAEMRLQWWRDALDEIRQGGIVRRHEVVTSLAHVIDAGAAARLDGLVAARRWDIERAAFEDAAHLDHYIAETGGRLMAEAAHALAGDAVPAAMDLGWASGLAAFLRAVPQFEAAGRVPLVDGRPEAVRALARQGLARLAAARQARGAIPAAARPALLAGWQAGAILSQAAGDPARVGEGRLGLSPAAARLRLIWMAATGRF